MQTHIDLGCKRVHVFLHASVPPFKALPEHRHTVMLGAAVEPCIPSLKWKRSLCNELVPNLCEDKQALIYMLAIESAVVSADGWRCIAAAQPAAARHPS